MRVPRFRLSHLFALLTLTAVLVWIAPKVGLELIHKPDSGSRATITWKGGEPFELWDTFRRPANVAGQSIEPRFLSSAVPAANAYGLE